MLRSEGLAQTSETAAVPAGKILADGWSNIGRHSRLQPGGANRRQGYEARIAEV
jgi:hypothetical protein